MGRIKFYPRVGWGGCGIDVLELEKSGHPKEAKEKFAFSLSRSVILSRINSGPS